MEELGLFSGWDSMLGALIEAVVFYLYAILLLRVAGKTTVGTARIFDFVSTVAMGTMVGSTIISSSIALTTGLVGLTALVALQWSVAYASSHSGRFYRITTNTPRLLSDGSRFLDDRSSPSVLKKVVLRMAVGYTNLTTGTRLTDAHNGLRVMRREVGAVHSAGGTLAGAFAATHAALAPRYGRWPIFEHCLPFDVSRMWDELAGSRPIVWTAERDRQVWAQLQE